MSEETRKYWIGMARGGAGAVLFSLPLLMTMELWRIGFYAAERRLILFLLVGIPILIGMSHYSGIRDTNGWIDDIPDALSAYAIGFVISAGILLLFGVVRIEHGWRDAIGKISIEAVPAAFGAVLAQSQFGQPSREASRDQEAEQARRDHAGYWAQLFLMGAGALYLTLSVAPTQEIVLIAFKMDPMRGIISVLVSIGMLHAFVYALQFRGQEDVPKGMSVGTLLARYTVVGYAICLLLSAYVLWTFGRFEGRSLSWIVMECVVLAIPASVGAAAARLIL